MRRNNTEINIFSMSALDLFASALGAFILLSIIFMPFFPNTFSTPDDMAERFRELNAQNANLTDQNANLTEQNLGLTESVDALEASNENLNSENARLNNENENLGTKLDQCENRESALNTRANTCESNIASLTQDATRNENAIDQCKANLDRAAGTSEQCQRELDKTFLLVTISWQTSHDVDLHIVDPAGREFYFAKTEFRGLSAAKFEEDTKRGPGNEIWLHPDVVPGLYQVYYRNFPVRGDERNTSPVTVRGTIVYRKGRKAISDVTMNDFGPKKLITTIRVNDDGTVSLE